MKLSLKLLILTITLLITGAFFCEANQNKKITINEIAWMGTENSHYDEWVELYNNNSDPVSLDGWKLSAEDETPVINLKGEIPAKGFFVLERTDDNTLSDIKANLIYKGSLNNKGENLQLTDENVTIVDKLNCDQGWFSGDNKTKQTMVKKSPELNSNKKESWGRSQKTGGTPGQKNNFVKIPTSNNDTKSLNSIGQSFSKKKNPWVLFLIAVLIAVISGVIIFVASNKFKKQE